MSYLTSRAEEALLGALLADQAPPPALFQRLDVGDLSRRQHQQLYSTIGSVRGQQPHLRGDALLAAVAARSTAFGVDGQRLRELRADCPDPTHLAVYARMIATAAFHRDIANHADRLAETATATAPGERDEHVQRLAEALGRHAVAYGDLAATTDEPTSSIQIADLDPRPARGRAAR